MPNSISEIDIEDIIEYVKTIFTINKGVHYIIFPLQGSSLKRDIWFSRYHILVCKKEDALLDQIASITSIDKSDVKQFLEHTKRSRSRDFLKSNIMIIEVENQTGNVRDSAYQLAQNCVDVLSLLQTAYGIEVSVFTKVECLEAENRHVAILSKDGWRCGHGYNWNAHLQCKIDLDFMDDILYQTKFAKLYESITIRKNSDELSYKFINAFRLFSRGLVQRKLQGDEALAMLLYFTSLESLITESQQEKRLRLAAILPKLVDGYGYSSRELSTTIDELYKQRNDFVHAGRVPSFSFEDKKLECLERVTALMILKYLDIDTMIELKSGQTRLCAWDNYLDKIFKDIIFC
ncbi:hypothetical protein SDC9_137852 [bioreactor metagenome]|uniref:Uncharacterized protein n=1 Tax=bioreactor metagenome TaxID=1076179 RepID=A0A645DMQ8_9ZZZZ